MSSSSCPTNSNLVIVVDTSVVINLNATGCALDVLKAFPNKWVVTEHSVGELKAGERNGHDDVRKLLSLCEQGAIDIVYLDDENLTFYESLIDGSEGVTLDDGEASAISYACKISGMVTLDERKARRFCASRLPHMPIMSSAEIFLHDAVCSALGRAGQAEALMNALQGARMRVLPEQIDDVVALIGEDKAASCLSLKQLVRSKLIR